MTKKRFMIDDCGTLIDMVTRKHYDYVSDVVDVLNDLDSENTHLKYSLGAYMVDLNNYKGKCSALEKENEQLKNELRIYRELANCSNCQYHNYDTLFGGDDEYEVCDKGNDVTDGICKDWREL